MKAAITDTGHIPVATAGLPLQPTRPGLSNTVLVADDDYSTLRLVEFVLTRAGYEVLQAEDGQQVMDMLSQTRPSLLLLDCDMPKMDGLEVCRRVKRDPELAAIPVIFLTVLASPTDKANGFAAGGDDYIVKPVERVELLARIRKQLELTRTQAQVHEQAKLFCAHADRLHQGRTSQRALLADVSKFADLKIALHYEPAVETSGDFYEVCQLSADEYGLLVAQLTGEPVRGCFLIGAMKALAATLLNASLSVQETLVMLNTSLGKCLGPKRQVSAVYVKYSRSSGRLELGRAGDLGPLIQDAKGRYRQVDACGDPLGIREDAGFETQTLSVEPGQRLFLFTDGMMPGSGDADSPSTSGGLEQLKERLSLHQAQPIQQTVDSVTQQTIADAGSVGSRDLLLIGLEF